MAADNASYGSHDSKYTDDLVLDGFDYSDDNSNNSCSPPDDDCDAPFAPWQEIALEIAYDEVMGLWQHVNLDSESGSKSEMEGDAPQVQVSITCNQVQPNLKEAWPKLMRLLYHSTACWNQVLQLFQLSNLRQKLNPTNSTLSSTRISLKISSSCFSIDVKTGGDRADILQFQWKHLSLMVSNFCLLMNS